MGNISFQYPTWCLFCCVALGLGYALLLYFRDRTFKEKSQRLNWLLGTVRFLAVTLISALLMSPLLKSILTETQKPIIVIAQDQSESVQSDIDETALPAYRQSFEQMTSALSQEYEVKQYAFGNSIREGIDYQFTDKVSNISKMLQHLYDIYSNQNLGAVILATDGIYNEGSNPIYAGTKLSAPIYTLALGDSTQKKDLILKHVFHNKIAYLGDKFSVQIDIAAQNLSQKNATLRITKIQGGKTQTLQNLPIAIDNNDFFQTKEIILEASQSGVQRYRISLTALPDEASTINNTREIFIDVLDARQKILLLANSPHPDLSAIKQTILQNKNYEVTTDYIDNMKTKVTDFDFVILHQLPAKTNKATAVLRQLNDKKIARLFVLGTQSDIANFNKVQGLLNVSGDGRNTNNVQATVASNFNLFTIDDAIKSDLPNFAPLTAPFGEFNLGGNAQTLLYQRIGKIDTKYPLLVLGEQNGIKTGILAAEGIWKWKFFDYLQNNNHDIANEIIEKTVQYLSLKEDKRKFRINLDNNVFNENDPILFDAQLYNENYELINEPDVSLAITNEDNKEFNYTFNKKNTAYSLNAGYFPVGNYKYKGTVFSAGQQLTFNGQFSVQPIQLEQYETTANHSLLKSLSDKFGGKMLYPNQINQFAAMIQNKETVKPVIFQTTKTRSIVHLKWIFFLLLSLLSIEWFSRRYYGGY